MTRACRYAVYWTPSPAHPLWQAGFEWLNSGHQATGRPRRYGFHATLKAPMALRADALDDTGFLGAVRELAACIPRFAMPRLAVATLGEFVALRPSTRIDSRHPLRRMADDCVRELDAWRAPVPQEGPQDRAERGALTKEQETLWRRWGYPHVFDHWRFHMTLSDPLAHDADGDVLRRRIVDDARSLFAPVLDEPLACDALSVFVEPMPGASFQLAERFPLAH